jgi:predicted ester cyclase
MSGTHDGEFMGMPATGKKVEVSGYDIVHFKDDKVVEHWGVIDTGALMEQLGAAPGA